MNKKITTLLFFCCLINASAFSQSGVVNINKIYLNSDHNKKLILVNQDIEWINSSSIEPKTTVLSDGILYTLATAVLRFELGKAYKVSDIQGENYDLYFTELPVINITSSDTIVDEPRVYARFSMCEHNGNFIENPIGIEYRGGWSQSLPKKSLRIEFWNDSLGQSSKDFSLLGMRDDADWNIQALYNEPLRLRSKVNNELWRKIDHLHYAQEEPDAISGVRMEYVELFVNKEYRGLYALSERTDRKQLKLKKYKDDQIIGELYRGISWYGATTFSFLSSYDNNSEVWSGFEYKHPDEKIEWKNIYDFVDFVLNSDSASFYQNYRNKFNIDNAVNYFIFLNLLRATDNTGKNLFIARYKTGEPYFYAPHDLDGTFGIIWDGTKANITNDILKNGFYKRLLLDNKKDGFLDKLKTRWMELRTTVITQESILSNFTTQYDFLNSNGVYERELIAWPNCEFFDYHNLDYTHTWLKNRLLFLDNVFNNPVLVTNTEELTPTEKPRVNFYPNPASDYLNFDVADEKYLIKDVSIINPLGQLSSVHTINKNTGNIDISYLCNGVYFIAVNFSNGIRQVAKLIVKK